MRQGWVARWEEEGKQREFRFTSLCNRGIARIDLGLRLVDSGYSVPEHVELEEVGEPTQEYENGGWTHTKTALGFPVSHS